MCKKGSRCWSDTSARKVSLDNRVTKAKASLKTVRANKTKASKEGNFNAFSKFRKQEETLVSRVESLNKEIRHNQRDMDGTKTGRNQVEEQLAHVSDPKERKELEGRLAAASALRFARQYAYEQDVNPRIPLLRIA
jgi:predicted  nucleic acid-binding Zn-ribbon protein